MEISFLLSVIILNLSSSLGSKHSDWMANLPIELYDLPLTEIAIPGSHDSGTYSLKPDEVFMNGIRQQSSVFADFVESHMNQNKAVLGKLIYRWSKTQNLNIIQQLEEGIRYLDLRIAFDSSSECRIVHGLFGPTLTDILQQTQMFLEKHSKEIILLDMRKIYDNVENVTQTQAIQTIKEIIRRYYGDKMVFSHNTTLNTIKDFWENNVQVIVFLPTQTNDKKDSVAHASIRSPFDYKSFTQLTTWLNFLELNYNNTRRQPRTFYVTQGIMQPHWMEIFVAGISEKATLKDWVSDQATETISKWLLNKKIGENGINIVIADFVEYHNYTDAVIKLNDQKSFAVRRRRKTSSADRVQLSFMALYLSIITLFYGT